MLRAADCARAAKKKRRIYTIEPQPDAEREEGRVQLRMPVVDGEFAAELANASRAATRAKHWHEYQRASQAVVRVLEREADKGARVVYFNVINPDRQFSQSGDMNRYGDAVKFMMKGKSSLPLKGGDDDGLSQMMGCVPQRER